MKEYQIKCSLTDNYGFYSLLLINEITLWHSTMYNEVFKNIFNCVLFFLKYYSAKEERKLWQQSNFFFIIWMHKVEGEKSEKIFLNILTTIWVTSSTFSLSSCFLLFVSCVWIAVGLVCAWPVRWDDWVSRHAKSQERRSLWGQSKRTCAAHSSRRITHTKK